MKVDRRNRSAGLVYMLKFFSGSGGLKSRKILVVCLLILIISGIATIFWYQAYVYSIPTDVPHDYQVVNNGTRILLEKHIDIKPGKPVFIHFFNPECPCSRFNLKEFKSIAQYKSPEATFVVVVLGPEKYSVQEIRERFHIDYPIVFDKSLARECGVYSTPQAVILNKDFRLHYRGNYNRNRYCSDSKTSFARIALDQLSNREQEFKFGPSALKAYGCSIEKCVEQ